MRPFIFDAARSTPASSCRASAGYTVPVGLFGELMMTARVRAVMRDARSSRSIWESARAGESTQRHPAASIHTRYSGKNGAMTTTSSPGSHTALMQASMAAAAPIVRYRSAAV